MSISQLTIHHFRNLSKVQFEPQPGINFFFGANGSGKTSILEAIYFLGLGRSFRTHLIQRIIHQGSEQFLLLAQINNPDNPFLVGMERSLQGEKKIRVNGESVNSVATIAKQLPLQLLSTESHRFFHDGPKVRRQYLDWGVFHVEHCLLLNLATVSKSA